MVFRGMPSHTHTVDLTGFSIVKIFLGVVVPSGSFSTCSISDST
jgi:hypothetical protein